jgi:hypothetical protein
MAQYSGIFTTTQQMQAKAANNWPSVPGAPTIGTATGGNAQASVTFTAPADPGVPAITGYIVTSNPEGITASGGSSPIVVTGLTNGTSYTFTVQAINATGTSPSSAASNSVTPSNAIPVSLLLIAGGGPGGATASPDGGGGGGGAGGLLYYGSETPKTPNGSAIGLIPGTTYTITIGAGGTGSEEGGTNTKGTNTTITGSGFTTLTAFAGGRGGGFPGSGGDLSGGSGGGQYTGTTGSVAGQGNNGADGNGGPSFSGGGGGGAGAVGQGGAGTNCNGGIGLQYSITGTATYYAGGGAGKGRTTTGTGGAGGGANGGSNNGTVNTGGGGGGGISESSGNGGSGICIISSSTQASSITGTYTLITSGGNYIYRFTNSGTITY